MKSRFPSFHIRKAGTMKRSWILIFLMLAVSSSAWGQDRPGKPGICPQLRQTVQAPDEYLHKKNPLEATESNLLAGKTMFHVDARPGPCRTCHGTAGNGLGITFRQLQPKPRNFTCYDTMKHLQDGQLFWIIRHGSPGTAMPAFASLEDDQIWQLVLYLRTLVKP